MDAAPEEKKDVTFWESFSILFSPAHASRAFWLINLVNFIDGVAYFGILTLLTRYLGTRVGMSDETTSLSVSLFTGFVTLFMFGGGAVSDRLGVRNALTFSLGFLFGGRVLTTLASASPAPFATAWIGLLCMAFGSGVIQPALYAGTKEYTDPKIATIGYAVLYSIMNLGICLGEFLSPIIRTEENFSIFWLFNVKGLNLGYEGVFWACSGITFFVLLAHLLLFTRHIEESQRVVPREETKTDPNEKKLSMMEKLAAMPAADKKFYGINFILSMLFLLVAVAYGLQFKIALAVYLILFAPALMVKTLDIRFVFFIFILLPVRTLFAHQFLTLPDYVFRAFPPEISARFEWINIINPMIIVFFVTPIAALTRKVKIINMMIYGTLLSAITTFILVPGPHLPSLLIYIVLFSLGEAIWSSRFLEYVADIAPPGKVGSYMGLAGIPWFLAKTTTGFYSGFMLDKYIPAPLDLSSIVSWFGFADWTTPFIAGTSAEYYVNWFFIQASPKDSGTLWLIYAFIACISPIGLMLGKSWVEKSAKKDPMEKPAV